MKDVDRIRIRKGYASCPGRPSGGSKELSSQTQIYAIPCRLQLPTNKRRPAGPGRSLYLLSITSLAALGGQYHSLSSTEFSTSKRAQPHRQKVMPGQKSIYETFLGGMHLLCDRISDRDTPRQHHQEGRDLQQVHDCRRIL